MLPLSGVPRIQMFRNGNQPWPDRRAEWAPRFTGAWRALGRLLSCGWKQLRGGPCLQM